MLQSVENNKLKKFWTVVSIDATDEEVLRKKELILSCLEKEIIFYGWTWGETFFRGFGTSGYRVLYGHYLDRNEPLNDIPRGH